ncbi:hypothetical protein LQV05_001362 [Cryptococcus neoformans]|nr:hypothetical protein J007_02209 [Cryptococcus neoformans var. grubii]OXC62298.1 hypothetical protein C358_02278 [Cryptococcus neoformans var. grubii MW-RSA852]UOH84555.1 hypothetical protein LQV05_001362 [Cryptococcus neoformans]
MGTKRATIGYISKVYGGAVAWRRKRQSTVALSTMEAEYMATTDAARQALWLQLLLGGLQVSTAHSPFPILNDNAGAVAIAHNPSHHEKTKHWGIRLGWLREKLADGSIQLTHTPSKQNLADPLTKSLSREIFESMVKMLGMERVEGNGKTRPALLGMISSTFPPRVTSIAE